MTLAGGGGQEGGRAGAWEEQAPSLPLPWVFAGLWEPEPGLTRAQPRDSRND